MIDWDDLYFTVIDLVLFVEGVKIREFKSEIYTHRVVYISCCDPVYSPLSKVSKGIISNIFLLNDLFMNYSIIQRGSSSSVSSFPDYLPSSIWSWPISAYS